MNSWLMTTAISWARGRLSEASTWASVAAALAASLHTNFNTDATQSFITLGVALAAFLGVVVKEGVKA